MSPDPNGSGRDEGGKPGGDAVLRRCDRRRVRAAGVPEPARPGGAPTHRRHRAGPAASRRAAPR